MKWEMSRRRHGGILLLPKLLGEAGHTATHRMARRQATVEQWSQRGTKQARPGSITQSYLAVFLVNGQFHIRRFQDVYYHSVLE